MRKKPTPASLRAGQTVWLLCPFDSLIERCPVIEPRGVKNPGIRRARQGDYFPWGRVFYSRRQVISAGRRLLEGFEAHLRSLPANARWMRVNAAIEYLNLAKESGAR